MNAKLAGPQLAVIPSGCVKGYGSEYTLIHRPRKTYQAITEDEIRALLDRPEEVEKAQATWFIPSSYRANDARVYAVQRDKGEYWWMTVDLDEGTPSLDALRSAVAGVLGPVRAYLYTSRSATKAHEKCRALIPLARPVSGEEWGDIQLAFFDLLHAADARVVPDEALARPAIPVYLPNRAPDGWYRAEVVEGPRLDIWAREGTAVRRAAEAIRAARAKEQAEADARRAARLAEAERRRESGEDEDLVGHFNATYDLVELMLHFGYVEGGRVRGGDLLFSSPNTDNPNPAVRVYIGQEPMRWTSRHQSDAKKGIGKRSSDGGCNGDAWDLFVAYQHNGSELKAKEDYRLILEERLQGTDELAVWTPDYKRVTDPRLRAKMPAYKTPNVTALAVRLNDLVDTNKDFRMRWEGRTVHMKNKSPKALDMRIAKIMAAKGFTFGEVVFTLCRLYPHGGAYVGLEGEVPRANARWAKNCAFNVNAPADPEEDESA